MLYVLIPVLVFGFIGGLLIWKTKKSKEESEKLNKKEKFGLIKPFPILNTEVIINREVTPQEQAQKLENEISKIIEKGIGYDDFKEFIPSSAIDEEANEKLPYTKDPITIVSQIGMALIMSGVIIVVGSSIINNAGNIGNTEPFYESFQFISGSIYIIAILPIVMAILQIFRD